MDNRINKASKNWYVVYTRSRAEKRVYSELVEKNIECFLPLQKQLRQWKDRKKWVETPLISGYCFVKTSQKEYETVLQTSNVIGYVKFEGKAAIIPTNQIVSLKALLKQNEFEVSVSQERFKPGRKVEILEGPLIGMQGELVDLRGKNKFILRINHIQSAFTVEIPAEQISFLSPTQ